TVVYSDTQVTPVERITGEPGLLQEAVLVATFTDADTQRTSADYEATVDWGDGRGAVPVTSILQVDGGFQVWAAPGYDRPGSYAVTVPVTALYRQIPDHTSTVIFRRSVTTHATAIIAATPVPLTADATPASVQESVQLPDGLLALATFSSSDPDAAT